MKNHHHHNPIHARPPAPVAPSHAAIADRAHALWLELGRPENQDRAIWLEAEALLLAGRAPSPANPTLSVDS